MSGPSLTILPLGGLGEIGMNCLALQHEGDILLVDCGVTFDDRGFGVDVVHPDFRALERLSGTVRALFVTHGHEDHIGAIPYLLKRYDLPIYAPRYVVRQLRERAREHEILREARVIEVSPRERIGIGSFVVEPIRVTHSIIDATALAIHVGGHIVVHTGDFKFDEAPPDGELTDVERLEELGIEGVSLLFSDSTNVDSEGCAGGEESVREELSKTIAGTQGIAVVGLFASNIHRLRILGDIALSLGRKLVLLGRGVRTHAGIARSIRALQWPSDLVVGEEYAHEFAREKLLVLATGSQGEQRAALGKLSRDEIVNMRLQPGDAVILSSRVIPGHEMDVVSLTNKFIRKGLRVISRFSNKRIHVSGHAYRDEQKRMIELLQPAIFVPVHGTLHHMVRHAELARETGVRETLVMENGTHAEADLEKKQISVVEHRKVETIFTHEGREVSASIVRERMELARAGMVTALIEVKGNMCSRVVLRSFGAIEFGPRDKGPRDLGHAMEREILHLLLALPSPSSLAHADWEARAHETVRREVRRLTKQKFASRPEVDVFVSFLA